jgi:hypothetical protein
VEGRGLDVRDLVLGVIGAGMVVFAVFLLFAGGERDTGGGRVGAPVITLVQPTAGTAIRGPLHVVFDVRGSLERLPTGWGSGDLHIHLALDGREFMPGPRDIEALPNGMYRWTLPGLPAGEHEIRLFWAGRDHRPMLEGASMPVRVQAH